MDSTSNISLDRHDLAALARARAVLVNIVNAHFTTLPDLGFVERLRTSEFTSVLGALSRDETAEVDLAGGASQMREYIEATREIAAPQLSETLGVDRTRLYRGVSPTYGPPPPYEAVWTRTGENAPAVLQAVTSIFRGAGLSASPKALERADYIGLELEFIQQLAQQEAEAWEAGRDETARNLLKTQADFLCDHVGAWAPDFIEKALPISETDMYRGHLRMLHGVLAQEKERTRALLEETL